MKTTTPTALASLPAAEAHLVAAIEAAASALDTVATDAVDAALHRLELAVRGAHCRMGAAMGQLRDKIGEVVECMEALASGIVDDLSANAILDRHGDALRRAEALTTTTQAEAIGQTATTPPARGSVGRSDPADRIEPPVSASADQARPTFPRMGDERGIFLTDKDDAEEARQEAPATEATIEPPPEPIDPPAPDQEHVAADRVEAIAACPPVEDAGRDDRKTPTAPRPTPTPPATDDRKPPASNGRRRRKPQGK